MSRRLINGRDWRLLTAAISGGFRRFSSFISRDNRDVSLNYFHDTVLNIGSPSVAVDWCKHIDDDDGYQCSSRDIRDVSLYFPESTSGSPSIVVDWYQRKDDEYQRSLWDSCSHSDDDDDDHELLDEVFDCSQWDNRDVSLKYFYGTETTSGPAVAFDWCRLMDDDFQCSPWDNGDVSLKYFYGTETTRDPSVAFDWCRLMDDDFQRSLWASRYDGDDELLDDVVDEVFYCRGPGSFLGKSGMLPVMNSGMLPDINNGTSIIQGGDLQWEEAATRELSWSASTSVGPLGGCYSLSSVALVGNRETVWDVCGYKRGIAGTSDGFFSLRSISSAELGIFLRDSAGFGCKLSSTWHHNVTHAIAATDPNIGSTGTIDFLVSFLENKKRPRYFVDAHTRVFFLLGGRYGRGNVHPILSKQIRMRASTTASIDFEKSLYQKQPKNLLRDSEAKVHVLVWFYSTEEGLGFHGMWVGEIDREKVNCISNDLKDPLYKNMLPSVEQQVQKLPQSLLDEIEELWIGGKPRRNSSILFAAKQFLKHVVQGETITVDVREYWQKATEFAKIFTHEMLLEIMNEDYEEGKFYSTKGLRDALSQIYGKAVRVTFINTKHGAIPCSVTALMDNNYNRIDHVDVECKYPNFRLNLGRCRDEKEEKESRFRLKSRRV